MQSFSRCTTAVAQGVAVDVMKFNLVVLPDLDKFSVQRNHCFSDRIGRACGLEQKRMSEIPSEDDISLAAS